ncbi:uncharacterized protein [Ptychodera flava]|uniref:uncharacterized protein n=1 Tax=Ptychodera flava TaxID=63121 RepID=UPI003969D979
MVFSRAQLLPSMVIICLLKWNVQTDKIIVFSCSLYIMFICIAMDIKIMEGYQCLSMTILWFLISKDTAAEVDGCTNNLKDSSLNFVVEKGKCLKLSCYPQPGNHTANDILWYFNGTELPKKMYRVKNERIGELIIDKVDFAHSGFYSCKSFEDPQGYVNLKTYDITIGTKPDAKLHCTCSNHQEIFCSWNETFSNLQLIKSRFSWRLIYSRKFHKCVDVDDKKGMLCICQTKNSCYFPRDYGTAHMMRLKLKNALGSSVVKLLFDPDYETVPNKVESLVAIVVSSNEISLNWSSPQDWLKQYMLHYKISYAIDTPYIWNEEEVPRVDQTEMHFKQLQPFTTYFFRVACLSDYVYDVNRKNSHSAWSSWSKVVNATTKEAAPTGSVEILINRQGNSEKSAIKWEVEWKPLLDNQTNGIILGYRIYLTDSTSMREEHKINHVQTNHDTMVKKTQSTIYHLQANATSYKIKDLQPGHTYSVKIVAYNSVSESYPTLLTIQPVLQRESPTNERILVIVIVILTASAVGVVILVVVIPYVCKIMKKIGLFLPVPRIKLPSDSEEYDYITDMTQIEHTEVYDGFVKTKKDKASGEYGFIPVNTNGLSDFYSVYSYDIQSSFSTNYVGSDRRGEENNLSCKSVYSSEWSDGDDGSIRDSFILQQIIDNINDNDTFSESHGAAHAKSVTVSVANPNENQNCSVASQDDSHDCHVSVLDVGDLPSETVQNPNQIAAVSCDEYSQDSEDELIMPCQPQTVDEKSKVSSNKPDGYCQVTEDAKIMLQASQQVKDEIQEVDFSQVSENGDSSVTSLKPKATNNLDVTDEVTNIFTPKSVNNETFVSGHDSD